MKLAIEIDDALMKSAEETAKNLGLSPSELFAKAMDEFLRRREEARATAEWNAYAAENDTSLDPALAEMQARTLSQVEWEW